MTVDEFTYAEDVMGSVARLASSLPPELWLTPQDIADDLGIRLLTVREHLHRLYKKQRVRRVKDRDTMKAYLWRPTDRGLQWLAYKQRKGEI